MRMASSTPSTSSSALPRPRVWCGEFTVDPKRFQGRAMSVATNPTLSVALLPLPEQEIWRKVEESLTPKRPLPVGLLHLYCPANSWCSLSVNENCDSTVRSDMLEGLRRIANGYLDPIPKSSRNTTALNHKNSPDTNAIVMDVLTRRSLTLPISNGQLMLGTWQGVYLFFDTYYCSPAQNGAPVIHWAVVEGAEYERVAHNASFRGTHALGTYLKDADLSSSFGCLTALHTHHTSASLCLRDKKWDLENDVMEKLVPDCWNDDFFQHTAEGRDDMTGHMKSTLLGCSAVLNHAVCSAKEAVLNEHRDCGGWGGGHSRKVSLVQVLFPSEQQAFLRINMAKPYRQGQPGTGEGAGSELQPEKLQTGPFVDITAELTMAAAGASGMLHVSANRGARLVLAGIAVQSAVDYISSSGNVAVFSQLLQCSIMLPAESLSGQGGERVFIWSPDVGEHEIIVAKL
ncbi:unnamed protein product [Amoebophrya sp. A25]|nr:unnamed protein product [Amoebophrya sp. A25]|eukprot:GSA25T00011475001.1